MDDCLRLRYFTFCGVKFLGWYANVYLLWMNFSDGHINYNNHYIHSPLLGFSFLADLEKMLFVKT